MTEDRVENLRNYVLHVVSEFFGNHFPENADTMRNSFYKVYLKQELQYVMKDDSEIEGIRRIIVSFRPALSSVLELCAEFDALMTMVQMILKPQWDGAHRRQDEPVQEKRGPIMPGSDPSVNLVFICSVCGEEIDVPHETKKQILNSEEEVELPQHCGQIVKIKISRTPVEEEVVVKDEPYEPIELLMGHVKANNVEYMKVLSVGIDIGSSTSHLIFSRLTLKREISFFNMTNRFVMVDREIVYESPIIFTPLLDRFTIDVEAVVKFCKEEYKKAGVTQEEVETGAVIVTGETAKKKNADEIIQKLSSESGKFVSAVSPECHGEWYCCSIWISSEDYTTLRCRGRHKQYGYCIYGSGA
ncbi:MAG: ethanolamine ammonia-lyase reactivating factor EutA [Candidatus Thorarchaeota archaeon]